MSFVELIAYYAAPTLEGMKPSCLFSCRDSEVGNVEELVLAYNRCLNPNDLSSDFEAFTGFQADPRISQGSSGYASVSGGYTAVSVCFRIRLCEDQINVYHRRNIWARNAFVMKSVSFSNIRWIVVSFIQHNGKNYQEIGYWKIYHNLSRARKTTARFLQSMECTLEKLQEGIPLEQLITA